MKKSLNIILILVFTYLSCLGFNLVNASFLDDCKEGTTSSAWRRCKLWQNLLVENVSNPSKSWADKNVDDLFKTVNSYVLYLYGIIAIGCFLYVGFMFITALGKPEEAKKAWYSFMWIVLGLALIPLAYVLVTIVAGLNLSN